MRLILGDIVGRFALRHPGVELTVLCHPSVEVAERAFEVVSELDTAYQETALVCAHGGLITGLTARMLELPVELWPGLGGISNCHWVVLTRRTGTDRWRLTTYNGGVPA